MAPPQGNAQLSAAARRKEKAAKAAAHPRNKVSEKERLVLAGRRVLVLQGERSAAGTAALDRNLFPFARVQRLYAFVVQEMPKGGPSQQGWATVAAQMNDCETRRYQVGRFNAKNCYEKWLQWTKKMAATGNPTMDSSKELRLMNNIKKVEVELIDALEPPEAGNHGSGTIDLACGQCGEDLVLLAGLLVLAAALRGRVGAVAALHGRRVLRPVLALCPPPPVPGRQAVHLLEALPRLPRLLQSGVANCCCGHAAQRIEQRPAPSDEGKPDGGGGAPKGLLHRVHPLVAHELQAPQAQRSHVNVVKASDAAGAPHRLVVAGQERAHVVADGVKDLGRHAQEAKEHEVVAVVAVLAPRGRHGEVALVRAALPHGLHRLPPALFCGLGNANDGVHERVRLRRSQQVVQSNGRVRRSMGPKPVSSSKSVVAKTLTAASNLPMWCLLGMLEVCTERGARKGYAQGEGGVVVSGSLP